MWLERTPDKREVGSSSLPRPTIEKETIRGIVFLQMVNED